MEAHTALILALRLVRHQYKVRPRIKLSLGVVAILILAQILSSQASLYFKSKKDQIKINGQAILVADNNFNNIEETEISGSVLGKLTPFSYNYPVVGGQISQGYTSYHNGFDIAAGFGTPIHPIGAGIVDFAGFVPDGHGNEVRVAHGDGLETVYAHMAIIEVGSGNMVNSSSVLGTVGLTGRTTGPHVHLEVWDKGLAVNPGAVLPTIPN